MDDKKKRIEKLKQCISKIPKNIHSNIITEENVSPNNSIYYHYTQLQNVLKNTNTPKNSNILKNNDIKRVCEGLNRYLINFHVLCTRIKNTKIDNEKILFIQNVNGARSLVGSYSPNVSHKEFHVPTVLTHDGELSFRMNFVDKKTLTQNKRPIEVNPTKYWQYFTVTNDDLSREILLLIPPKRLFATDIMHYCIDDKTKYGENIKELFCAIKWMDEILISKTNRYYNIRTYDDNYIVTDKKKENILHIIFEPIHR